MARYAIILNVNNIRIYSFIYKVNYKSMFISNCNCNYQFYPKKNSNYQISYLNKKKKKYKIILCIKPSHTLNELIVYIYIYIYDAARLGRVQNSTSQEIYNGGLVDQSLSTLPLVVTCNSIQCKQVRDRVCSLYMDSPTSKPQLNFVFVSSKFS